MCHVYQEKNCVNKFSQLNCKYTRAMAEPVDPRLRHGTVRELVPAAEASEKQPDIAGIKKSTDVATSKPTSVEQYGLDMDVDDDRGESNVEPNRSQD